VKRVATLLFVLLTACKSSEAPPPSAEGPQDASMQRPLPTGMLSPPPSATAPSAAAAPVAKSLKSVREATTGEWIELQPAPEGESPKKTKFDFFKKDSLFIPLDAMTLLHDSFARSSQGFALFTPQLFVAMTLGELKTQLREFKRTWKSVPTAAIARQRFPYSPRVQIALTDDLWRDFQGELVFTIDEIIQFADDRIKKGEGMWILPTQGH
jgi:hypothetical protein